MDSAADDTLLSLLNTPQAAEAFATLYNRYAQRLYRLAYQKTNSTDKAAEITQDVFVSLWEKRSTLLVGNLEHYLFSAVRYQVINHLRAVISERKFTDADSQVLPSGSLLDQSLTVEELQQSLDYALKNLPEKTRIVFEMSRYEQLPNKEIARQLELSEKAIEYHITQAIKYLRSYLKEFLE